MVTSANIEEAADNLKGVATATPLQFNAQLSEEYGCNIYLKREDLQPVRSYKLRGAYNKIASLSDEEKKRGVVCASAGNHAQGVAYACTKLKIDNLCFLNIIMKMMNECRNFSMPVVCSQSVNFIFPVHGGSRAQ